MWVPVPGIVDLEELEDQLGELPDKYVRIKGILRAIDGRSGDASPRWTAVHRVGLRVSSEPAPAPDFEEGRLVALGPAVSAEGTFWRFRDVPVGPPPVQRPHPPFYLAAYTRDSIAFGVERGLPLLLSLEPPESRQLDLYRSLVAERGRPADAPASRCA